MKILLFGKTGQVGWELQRSLALLGNLIIVDKFSASYCGNFINPSGIADTIHRICPDIIVNAAAYTKVDQAESNIELARLINSISVSAIAQAAEKIGAWVIHYSTDYVFPGTGSVPWKETDKTSPINIYGKTKLEGEQKLQLYCSKYLIFRTSWIYANRGENFIKKILNLATQRKELLVSNDQVGAPTSADMLADCTAHTIRFALNKPNISGIYHVVADGTTTWYNYAKLIFRIAFNAGIDLVLEKVIAVPSSLFSTLAHRPNNSRMNNEKFKNKIGLKLPHWKVGVKRILNEFFEKPYFRKKCEIFEDFKR